MPLKVFLATTADSDEPLHQFARELVAQHTELLKKRHDKRFVPASTAAEADIILFIEAPVHKFRQYADHLLRQKMICEYPNRCFAYDWEDCPAGFLPGVYPSLSRKKMDPSRFRTGGFLAAYTSIPTPDKETDEINPHLLFSFRGSARSHPVRGTLLQTSFPDPDILVAQVDRWFDHTEDDKQSYVREMLDSKFILCPRGLGPATFRVFEAMAAGRVPVILSDDWIAPRGPAWGDFALVIAEDRIAELPEIVRRYESCWREMGKAARQAWEQWYSPEVSLLRILQSVEEILLQRGANHDERDYQNRWRSAKFARDNGWTIPQKIAEAVRRGEALQRVRRRLSRGHPRTV